MKLLRFKKMIVLSLTLLFLVTLFTPAALADSTKWYPAYDGQVTLEVKTYTNYWWPGKPSVKFNIAGDYGMTKYPISYTCSDGTSGNLYNNSSINLADNKTYTIKITPPNLGGQPKALSYKWRVGGTNKCNITKIN